MTTYDQLRFMTTRCHYLNWIIRVPLTSMTHICLNILNFSFLNFTYPLHYFKWGRFAWHFKLLLIIYESSELLKSDEEKVIFF